MFQLQFPLKSFKIFQYFGNPDPIYLPLGIKGHNGLDLVATHGTPIYASHDGWATYEIDTNQGHGVTITTQQEYEYKAGTAVFKTIYWHMCDSSVEPQYKSPIEGTNGVQVKAGDLIGYADSTGFSQGNHLHFGLKVMKQIGNTYYNIEQTNGYLGAIDPFPYLPKVKYNFTQNLFRGNEGYDQVNDMQHFLYQRGFMDLVPYDQMGTYGPKTAQAVLLYQNSKWNLSTADKLLAGNFWGPKTRAFANAD